MYAFMRVLLHLSHIYCGPGGCSRRAELNVITPTSGLFRRSLALYAFRDVSPQLIFPLKREKPSSLGPLWHTEQVRHHLCFPSFGLWHLLMCQALWSTVMNMKMMVDITREKKMVLGLGSAVKETCQRLLLPVRTGDGVIAYSPKSQ